MMYFIHFFLDGTLAISKRPIVKVTDGRILLDTEDKIQPVKGVVDGSGYKVLSSYPLPFPSYVSPLKEYVLSQDSTRLRMFGRDKEALLKSWKISMKELEKKYDSQKKMAKDLSTLSF